MTPSCHTEAPPRVPGHERGHAPKQYPAGRICTQPGCGTVLRRTHKGPICDPCTTHAGRAGAAERSPVLGAAADNPTRATRGGARDHHACDDVATAPVRPPAGSNPAGQHLDHSGPAARATEEAKMGKESMREAVLMVFACAPSRCFNAGDVVKSSRVSPSCVYKNLKALVASGEIVKDAPGIYRWPKIEDAKTASATPPAPAPASMTGVPLGTEQPADVVAADSPMVEPPPAAGIVPFAGIVTTTFIGYSMSSELRILDNLEQLDDATRERVLQYAVDRWWLK